MGQVNDRRGEERPPQAAEGPVAAATPMNLIEAPERTVTPDYLDDRANGGPQEFQLLQMEVAPGRVVNRTLRGRTVWDGYAEAALAALVGQIEIAEPSESAILAAVKMAALAADAMIAESRKRNPQPMRIQAGSQLVQ